MKVMYVKEGGSFIYKETDKTKGQHGTEKEGTKINLYKIDNEWFYVYKTIKGTSTKVYHHIDYIQQEPINN